MLHAPVLQLDAAKMHEIDPRNVENLFGMWTVFSKCASTIPDGKRLENLSWRVWARETLCCPPQPEKTIIPALDVLSPSKEDVPSLSSSFGSDSDGGSLNSCLENSALSKSRGKETHLTPLTLERIITNIQEQKSFEPLDPEVEEALIAKLSPEKQPSQLQQLSVSDQSEPPFPNQGIESSCTSTATNATARTVSTERGSTHRDSDTSASSDGLIKSGSIVHGFSPVPSLRSRGSATITKNLPIHVSKTAGKDAPPKKMGMFTLGGSSEDDESSFEQRMSYRQQLLEPRKSSLSRNLTRDQQAHKKKTTSFREIVEQHTIQSGSPADDNAIASDEDDEDDDSAIDDSAIEEDDEEEGWEDEQPEEEKLPSHPVFKRVDSTANLPSRRSILTAGLTEGDRAKGLLNAASKSSPAIRRMNRTPSHNGPSIAGCPEHQNEDGLMMRTSKPSRAIDMPPPSSEDVYTMAHSPRTTRRNMLSTELTESLRKNLLWERQQKNTTVNAFLKREAKSTANLPRTGQMAATHAQPPRSLFQRDVTRPNNSYNEYFNVINEYHTKGW